MFSIEDGLSVAETGTAGLGRLVLARALTVLAVLVALVGMVAFYVEHTVLDEEGFETVATELIQDDEIRDQVALTAVDQLFANVDVEQAIARRLPEEQQGLAPALAGLSRQAAEQAASRVLQRPRVQDTWVTVATRTHEQLVKLLEDRGEFVSTEGGQVVLDLRPIVVELGNEVAVIGRAAERLPDSAGRIAIVDSDELETAQTLVRVLRFLANWLWVVALALAAAAIWLARGRRRTELRALAVGILAVGLLMLLVRRVAGEYVVDRLTSDATEPAGSNAWSIVSQGLADRAWLWVIFGAFGLAAVWLVGPSGRAARARRAVAPVAAHASWTYGILAALVLVLATLVPLFQRGFLSVVVFVAVLAVGVEAVRRRVLEEEREPVHVEPAGRSG